MLQTPPTEDLDALDLFDFNAEGRYARFFKLGDVGLKVYMKDFDDDAEDVHECSFYCQKFAANFGLAPQVGESLYVQGYPAFITQIIEPLIKHEEQSYEKTSWIRQDREIADKDWFVEKTAIFRHRVRDLLGLEIEDGCPQNFGVNPQFPDELMLLDWGNEEEFLHKLKKSNYVC